MASSPKRKAKSIRGLLNHPKWCLYFVCALSLILAIFILAEQTGNTKIYSKYIEAYGYAKPKDGKSDSVSDSKYSSSKNDSESNSEKKFAIKAVSILGERNSGTTWMYE